MNPLKEKQRKILNKLQCKDLADKVDEIVKYLNEITEYHKAEIERKNKRKRNLTL